MDARTIGARALGMVDRLHEMLGLIEKGFMQNRMEHLTHAMELEHGLNAEEKALTGVILAAARATNDEGKRRELMALEQMTVTLERMGDEAASIIERMEIKVSEKLLFSDRGVEQFNETYAVMKQSVEMMKEFIMKLEPALKDRVIDNGLRVKELVERYRQEHTERLIRGICTPMAANLFFDMLDFTGNLARHSSNIVKLF